MEKDDFKRKKIQDHFDSIASQYSNELPVYFQDYLLKRKMYFISKYCNNLQDKIGLDIGCGQGTYSEYLTKISNKMVGIDFSFNNVKNTLNTNNHGLNCDGTRLPFKSNYFDFCFSINVLHHLPSATLQDNFLNEMIRVVKPNGKVFIFDLSLKNPIFSFYLKYIFPRIRSIDEGDELFINAKKIVKKTTKETDLICIDYYSFIPDIITQPLLNILIKIEEKIEKTMLKRLGMHMVVVLQKKKK